MKNTMELVLFTGHAGIFFTPEMEKVVAGKDFPYSRMDKLVDYIKDTAVEVEEDEIFRLISDHVNAIYRLKTPEGRKSAYYCYDHVRSLLVVMRIVSVDLSKKWTVQKDFDGSETLRYMEPRILDRELNYCAY